MKKGVLLQCIYEIDEKEFPFVAFDCNGCLFGFINPPVRDFSNREWVDCVTGDTGTLIPYDKWDQSLREPKDFVDIHTRKAKAVRIDSKAGKRNVVYGTGDFTKYKYKLKGKKL